ncbi:hypothetical protein L3Q82_008242 [Scortum barcoo]|uniref:Uncharacterized protein n=1 Tax=Scortum barcoo TaxID=214431 RepID=A0ACB8WH68_9TELE|nr:hypothetical protein L3Q82_008242 [Scortum barcoo]
MKIISPQVNQTGDDFDSQSFPRILMNSQNVPTKSLLHKEQSLRLGSEDIRLAFRERKERKDREEKKGDIPLKIDSSEKTGSEGEDGTGRLTLGGFVLVSDCTIGLRRKLQTFPGKMVNTLHSDEEKGIQDKESKEESILAMLGIIGTILNLVVIIFVYIYTTFTKVVNEMIW